jgi:5S rRNA maturation endonuclease (ribonuclease M5)
LYNIPDILEAERVIWVEGEKCADDLKAMGYTATCNLGGAGMLSVKSAPSYDFSPLQGKQVIIWPDNDSAGIKIAKLVQDLSSKAGAKSVTMLSPPRGKPEKWDVSDAITEGFDINKFLNEPQHKTKQNISLKDNSLLISEMFVGKAPEQKFLIADTIPLGVPVVFAAAGDSGKGMMTLDLAMKVASGFSMQSSFGGLVSTHGNVVIMTAEDDKDELHRRVERLDPRRKRFDYEHDMRVLPLPNLGGVFPMMQKIDNSYVMGAEFERLYEQILEIDNLALFIADPMASFVHADINADPAAGAAFMGMLAQLSTETGATVMVNHHMAKIRENEPITTPEQARNLIRGTSAIVDGVRSAFSVWQVDEKIGRQRCKDLDITYTRNTVFDGGVVKSNGPANRDIRHFIRNQDTGLLEDRSQDIRNLALSSSIRQRIDYMYQFIELCEQNGHAVTKGGKDDGVFESIRVATLREPCVIGLKGIGESTIKGAVTQLQETGRIDVYRLTQGGAKKWLGTMDGAMANGTYEARTARENSG